MFKLKWMYFSLLLLVISLIIPDSFGMEKDAEPTSSSVTKVSVSYLSKNEFPAMPFYCMTSSSRPFSPKLIAKRSQLIRKTLAQIHRFSSLDKNELIAFQSNLHTSVIECVEICRSCDHPCTKLFSEIERLLLSPSKKKKSHSMDIRDAISKSLRNYSEILRKRDDLDTIDVRLMIQLLLGEFTQNEVFKKVKILSDAKRNEIAIYYLMNFAFAVHFGLGDPSIYYMEAKRLGCREADQYLLDLRLQNEDLAEMLLCLRSSPLPRYDSSEALVELLDSST